MLDTNVLSALMRDPPDATVVMWADRQDTGDFWTTSITVFEVRFGLARMAAGRKRDAVERAFSDLMNEGVRRPGGDVRSSGRGGGRRSGRAA